MRTEIASARGAAPFDDEASVDSKRRDHSAITLEPIVKRESVKHRTRAIHAGLVSALVLSSLGCSANVLRPGACRTDQDCEAFAPGSTCQTNGYCRVAMATNPVDGVSNAMVRTVGIGDLSGSLQDLGGGMRDGVRAAFAAYNTANPRSRQFVHEARDDLYVPANAAMIVDEVTRDQGAGQGRFAFAILGSMGSPTSLAMLPTINMRQVPFFGTYSGSEHLRESPPNRVVWNTRASYRNEARFLTTHMLRRDPDPIAPGNIFALSQSPVGSMTEGVADASPAAAQPMQTVLDAYGNSGYLGIVDELAAGVGGRANIPLATYRATGTNTAIAEAYFFQWIAGLAPRVAAPAIVGGSLRVAITMVAVASAATPFVRGVIDGMNQLRMGQKPNQLTAAEWGNVTAERQTALRSAQLVFGSISPVGDQLATNLRSAGAATYCTTQYPILVSQVVPFPTGSSQAAVTFRQQLAAYDQNLRPGFVNFEGWIAGQVWIAAVNATRGPLTVDSLLTTLADPAFTVDIGTGRPVRFTEGSHDGVNDVYGSLLGAGCQYVDFTFAR